MRELRAFYEQRGTLAMVMGMPPWLRQKIRYLRRRRQHGELPPERIAALDALKFQWEDERTPPPVDRPRRGRAKGPRPQQPVPPPAPPKAAPEPPLEPLSDAEAEELLGQAKAFREREGHWLIDDEKPRLKRWVEEVGNELAAGVLDTELANHLIAAGLPATHEAWAWERQYARLTLWEGRPLADALLGTWLNAQRLLAKGGKLPKERAERLEALGVELQTVRNPKQEPKPIPLSSARPQAKRAKAKDPAAVTRDELRDAGIPDQQIARWLQEGRLLQTGERNVFLKTRGMTEEIEKYEK